MDKKNNENKKVEKKIEKEIKKINKPKKKDPNKTVKKVKKEKVIKEEKIEVVEKKEPVVVPKEDAHTEPYFLENMDKIKAKKKKKVMGKLELIVVVVFSIIMLILLCNRTFFRTNYKTSKINIDIPLLMFFKSDDGNKLVLRTLRKSEYVRDYFDDKLKNMTKYNCNNTFYYDEENNYAIYDIKIQKDFVVKTVTINYAVGNADCLCNTSAKGKEAEKLCKK